MSNANGGFAKPVLLQVATAGETQKCPDFLLGRYNGHPGEDLSDLVLDNRGADMQWYYKDHQGRTHSGWPVKVRANRYVAIPNCQENLDILDKMAKHKWSERVKTESGHIERTVEHPPLYELVQEEVAQVSPSALLAAFAKLSDADKAAIMGMVTEPSAPKQSHTAPKFEVDDDTPNLYIDGKPVSTPEGFQSIITAMDAILNDPKSTKGERVTAGQNKRDAEAELAKLG